MTFRPVVFLVLCSAVLIDCALAQRTRVFGTLPWNGAAPVTAHRRVAWANGPFLQWWDGTMVRTVQTGVYTYNTVAELGFLGPNVILYTLTNATNAGLWLCDVTSPDRPVLGRIHATTAGSHADGAAGVFSTGADIGGLFGGGMAYSSLAPDSLLDSRPHVAGRFVAWQKRTSSTPLVFTIYRYDRQTGTTALMTHGGVAPLDAPRVDEAGRVIALGFAESGSTRTHVVLWDGNTATSARALTAQGEAANPYTYGIHHGQAAWRRLDRGAVLDEIRFEDPGQGERVLARSTLGGTSGVWLRNGMVAWASPQGVDLYDGGQTIRLTPGANPPSRSGEFLDRGWQVFHSTTSGVSTITLRESALTWEVDTLSASAGGTVQLSLQAGSANAGRQYVLLMSLAGTFPGVRLGSVTLPLNPDSLLIASLQPPLANSAILTNSIRILGSGSSLASFNATPGLLRGLEGSYLSFAYAVLSATGIEFVSNPARVKIVP